MSIIQDQQTYQNFQNYENYYMSLRNSKNKILITLLMNSNHISTGSIPKTLEILNEFFPNVLKTKCFNEANLPFREEVKNTEIGHLFEHTMLSYLCEAKIKSGSKNVCFSGITEWNWKKDAKGTFHIKIGINSEDMIYIDDAYEKSHKILKLVLHSTEASSTIN